MIKITDRHRELKTKIQEAQLEADHFFVAMLSELENPSQEDTEALFDWAFNDFAHPKFIEE